MWTLLKLGLIGGIPTIFGAWLGGLVYSRGWTVLFLGLGVGAIVQVIVQILRQMGRERGANVIDVDHDRKAIAAAVQEHLRRGKAPSDHLYGDGTAGQRIADVLATVPLTVEKRLTY